MSSGSGRDEGGLAGRAASVVRDALTQVGATSDRERALERGGVGVDCRSLEGYKRARRVDNAEDIGGRDFIGGFTGSGEVVRGTDCQYRRSGTIIERIDYNLDVRL